MKRYNTVRNTHLQKLLISLKNLTHPTKKDKHKDHNNQIQSRSTKSIASSSSTSNTISPNVNATSNSVDINTNQQCAPAKQLLLNRQEVLNDTKSTLDGLVLYECLSSIDRKSTVIEESSPIVLRYKTPYFRANATILLPPIEKKHTWTLGWIQACERMKFVNKYGDLGESGWEIPQLESKLVTAVSDSDGISYPWYGNSSEIATVCGPTKHHKKIVVRMNDNFYPSVTWDIPVSEKDQSRLTRVERDQNFVTWLAALNENTGELIVLRTIRWKFKIIINVNPDQPLGSRATLLHNHCDYINDNNKSSSFNTNLNNNNTFHSNSSYNQHHHISNNNYYLHKNLKSIAAKSSITDSIQSQVETRQNHNLQPVQSQPIALPTPPQPPPPQNDDNMFMPLVISSNSAPEQIPLSAMMRPSANHCQVLFWRPKNAPAMIVVPPKELYTESQKLVIFSGKAVMHRKDKSKYVTSISKDTLQRMKKEKLKRQGIGRRSGEGVHVLVEGFGLDFDRIIYKI